MYFNRFTWLVPVLVLTLACIPLFFISVADYASIIGDDYSQYLKESLNIINGKPYFQSNCIFNPLDKIYGPPQYPPGFPLLIAPVIYYFGLDIEVLLQLQTFFSWLLCIAVFFFLKRHMAVFYAMLLSLLCSYAAPVIAIKTAVISDMACALLVIVYLTLRQKERITLFDRILLPLIAFFALLVRTQMILLLVAECIFLLLAVLRKEIRIHREDILKHASFSTVLFSALLYLVTMKLIFPSPKSTASYYLDFLSLLKNDIISIIASNVRYLFNLYRYVFYYETDSWIMTLFVRFFMNVPFFAALIGCFLSVKKKWTVTDIYFFLSCGMVVLLAVYQGFRFLVSTLPIYLLYSYTGFMYIFDRLSLAQNRRKIAAGAAILPFLVLTVNYYFSHPPDLEQSFHSHRDKEAFAYIKDKVPDSSVILFMKPRALTLYTDKRTMLMLDSADSEDLNQMKTIGADYILVRKDLRARAYHQVMFQYGLKLDTTRINDYYTLYRINGF
jgi:hypothetical protein